MQASATKFGVFVAVALLAASAPAARAQHADIGLFDDSGTIGVALVDDSAVPEIFEPGVRAFEAILVPGLVFSPFDFDSDEPGFDVEDGEFPPSQSVDLIPVALEYWDGMGSVAFSAAPSGVAFDFDDAAFATDDEGGLHEHALFGLTGSGIPDGVYVGEFRVATAGLGDSPSIFLVMLKDALITADNKDELEDLLEAFEEGGPDPVLEGKNFAFFEEAFEAVEARLAVPEPNAVGLAALAACFGCGVGRRRRSL